MRIKSAKIEIKKKKVVTTRLQSAKQSEVELEIVSNTLYLSYIESIKGDGD
jgi:hypothetical protein